MEKMSPEERENIKIVPLCRNIGGIIALSGVIFLAKEFWSGANNHWFVVVMILWLVFAGLDVWYIEKGNRYRNT